jgi:endonuclease I/chitodextrinase
MKSRGLNRPCVIVTWVCALITTLLAWVTDAQAQVPAGYYDNADTSSPSALHASLHTIIDDHVRFPYTSTAIDTWDILEIADEDPDLPGNVITIYRNATYAKQGGGNALYNREHSWPKSYGFPNDGSGNYPYTDAHQLFIADAGYNSSRSNKPFAWCDTLCAEKPTDFNNNRGGLGGGYPGDSNWTEGSFTQGTWEVWNGRRGDIARALLYMDVRYEGGSHGITGVAEPDLVLTDNLSLIESSNTGSNESVAYMGLLSVLLQWHAEDPVDYIEQSRNEAVAAFQGNRNPLIDHPEWVDCLYLGSCSGGGGGNPTAWINEFHYDNKGSDTGEFVEIAGDAGADLSGWSVAGYNGSDGAIYATLLLAGVIPEQEGCMGTLAFDFAGLQNGAPDGLALIDADGVVVHQLAYEGSFTALQGPAAGTELSDIGVAETSRTRAGQSLQLAGTGSAMVDFSWAKQAKSTAGAPNRNQFLDGCGPDTTPPDAPSGLQAQAGDGQVNLSWNANPENDLAGYHVFRAEQAGGPYNRITANPLGQVLFTDTGLVNGVTYFYVVTAQDTAGNESLASNEAEATPTGGPSVQGAAWINEFHYDNDGTDTGEFVEVAGPAGLDLAGWTLVGYNGNGGGTYATVSLGGILPDLDNGHGVLAFDFAGLQNGAPDGIALVDNNGEVIELLAYEGGFTAIAGPAAGQALADIGVAESSSTPIGDSLQRTGSGTEAAAFSWAAPQAATRGSLNAGQDFGGGGSTDTEAPATPAGLTASGGNRQVRLAWAANVEADLAIYRLYRSLSSSSAFTVIAEISAGTLTYQNNGLANGTTYYYALSAVDTSGNESVLSAVVEATPAKKNGRK